jgi:hypothetical protein
LSGLLAEARGFDREMGLGAGPSMMFPDGFIQARKRTPSAQLFAGIMSLCYGFPFAGSNANAAERWQQERSARDRFAQPAARLERETDFFIFSPVTR